MLKKKLKLYFKVFFQKLFILIYGKIKTDDINYLNDDELIPINNIKSDTPASENVANILSKYL